MRAVATIVVLACAGLGALGPLYDPAPGSPLRHAYALPVLAAALRFGPVAGGLAAVIAVMAQAPRLFSHLEQAGLTASAVDVLIGDVLLLGLAPLIGALAEAARGQRARYETLLAVQRVVAEERPLSDTLDHLRALLTERCAAAALALVMRDGDRLTLAGSDRLTPDSMLARVLETGAPIFVVDAGTDPRPRRVLGVPLFARGQVIGALGLERVGELGGGERASLRDLAAYLGLALDNARLAAVQRRFNAELADKIAAATQRLQALDQSKSLFVATVSHELRTPLTAVLGFSELLALRPVPAEEVRRLAGIMLSETERLARLVDDLLDLARIEQGIPPRVRPVAVALGPALRAAVEVYRRGLRADGLVIAEAEELWVRADPDALGRIVRNLTANALKYSPPGSAVTLSTQRRDGAIQVTVADEGPGIEPDVLARIFEPYYRAAATRSAPGLGLGLAVVKALVEAQGGTIDVQSAPGLGTRVTFSLPPAPLP